MNRTSMFFAAITFAALVAIAGCKRDATPEPTPAADTQPVASDTMPVAAPEPAATPEAMPAESDDTIDTGLNAKDFAGTFSGTLPCADCPGIDTTLQLRADNTFALGETYRERKVTPSRLEGTWTAEEGGSRIRLDPNSKSEQDRLYAVVSRDQLTQLDQAGKPVPGALDFSLKRDAAKP